MSEVKLKYLGEEWDHVILSIEDLDFNLISIVEVRKARKEFIEKYGLQRSNKTGDKDES